MFQGLSALQNKILNDKTDPTLMLLDNESIKQGPWTDYKYMELLDLSRWDHVSWKCYFLLSTHNAQIEPNPNR